MFVDILMNPRTGKRRLFRSEDIVSIIYNGDKSINYLLAKTSSVKTKNFGITYESKEQATKIYQEIISNLKQI